MSRVELAPDVIGRISQLVHAVHSVAGGTENSNNHDTFLRKLFNLPT